MSPLVKSLLKSKLIFVVLLDIKVVACNHGQGPPMRIHKAR